MQHKWAYSDGEAAMLFCSCPILESWCVPQGNEETASLPRISDWQLWERVVSGGMLITNTNHGIRHHYAHIDSGRCPNLARAVLQVRSNQARCVAEVLVCNSLLASKMAFVTEPPLWWQAWYTIKAAKPCSFLRTKAPPINACCLLLFIARTGIPYAMCKNVCIWNFRCWSCLHLEDLYHSYLYIAGCEFFCYCSQLMGTEIVKQTKHIRNPQLFCFVLFCFVLFVLFCFVLFCFVLFCFVLFCFVLFCFVLFCFVLFCFVLFCFVLFCFVLFCFVLFCLFCFVLFCFVLFCFVLFCFVLFCFVLFCFVLFCFVLFCFVLFCFVLFCSNP